MEDPWGSPWTTATEYPPPKIDLPLPAPPPSAHFSASADHSPKRLSPARTPWDDEDAWGGWTEPAGKESPRWGRSPGLRPQNGGGSGSGPASRLPSPSPDAWGQLAGLEVARVRKDERNGDSSGFGFVDSARREVSRDRYLAPTSYSASPRPSVEDAWKRADLGASTESLHVMAKDPVDRPASPEQPPPGRAIHVETQPKLSRKPSKVQSLVEMYDGMAKRSRSVSPVDPPRQASSSASPLPSPEPRSEELVMPGLGSAGKPPQEGEFEEAEQVMAMDGRAGEEELVSEKSAIPIAPPLDDQVAVKAPPKEPQAPETPMRKGLLNHQENEAHSNAASPVETAREASTRLKIKPPSDAFSIDLSKVDELFSASGSFPEPEPVPDVIIDDTFASSGERKAWYLLSRPGSMRRYDLGDDENYVRVNWKSSEVRGQAIRIVRRWMEKDSIVGRVVLGRRTGPAGANIFNWDSSAPPVEISELLGRKSHSRHASTASKMTIASPTAPAFGWSSPIPSPTVAAPPPIPRPRPISQPPPTTKAPSTSNPTPITKPLAPSLQKLNTTTKAVLPLTSPTSPLAQQPHTAQTDDEEDDDDDAQKEDDDDDDDDDWGEMVSSPTDQTNAAFASIDEALESHTAAKATDASSFTEVVTPSDSGAGTASKTSSSVADWAEVPRPSFDVPSTQGFIPNSLSKGPTASWTDNRVSMDGSTRGFLSHSHSKSSAVSWNARTSLDAILSENLVPNKVVAKTKEKARPQSWAFGSMNFLDGAAKVPPTIKDLMPKSPSQNGLSRLSHIINIPDGNLPSGPTSPTTPRITPTPAPKEEFPKVDSPKNDSWGVDSWKDDSLEVDSSKDYSPRVDPSIDESPKVDSPKDDSLRADSSHDISLGVGFSNQSSSGVDSSEDDEIVATILQDLPDLSYMLR